MRPALWVFAFIVVLASLWRQCAPLSRAPGVLAHAQPMQQAFSVERPSISLHGWTLKPLAIFHVDARVLSNARYSEGPTAQLAPYDLALGWGRMSDTAVLEKLDITQSNRFYQWRFWGPKPPISVEEIVQQSTNAHMIPASESIREKLASLRKGALVEIRGLLVEATHPAGDRPWRSSLRRDDQGDGACEIIYVQSLRER